MNNNTYKYFFILLAISKLLFIIFVNYFIYFDMSIFVDFKSSINSFISLIDGFYEVKRI